MPAPIFVWRLCRQSYAEMAFSGEGPRLFGGRWNPVGMPAVYTSLSLSLAVLEVFVHLDVIEEPDDFVSVAAVLPADTGTAERVDFAGLPPDWRLVDHPALKAIGKEWLQSMRSLVLFVPSVVVEGEWNALINPAHPNAAKIEFEKPKPFHFDKRMFRR